MIDSIRFISFFNDEPKNDIILSTFDDIKKLDKQLNREGSILFVVSYRDGDNNVDEIFLTMTFISTDFEGHCVELLKKLVLQFGERVVIPFLKKTEDETLRNRLQLEMVRFVSGMVKGS